MFPVTSWILWLHLWHERYKSNIEIEIILKISDVLSQYIKIAQI